MQVCHKLKSNGIKMKKLALSIYYKSPSTFKYLRKNKIVVPGESTIRKWLKTIDFLPEFNKDYIS